MKQILVTLLFALIILSANSQSNLFNHPESVVYDSINFRYLVSNNGDGKIVQIDSLGVQSYYPMGINANSLTGLYIKDNLLFAASVSGVNKGVLVMDLNSGDSVAIIKPTGLNFLNDITADNQGFLYVTEYYNNKIFKVNLSNYTSWTYVSSGINYPNGILFDSCHNRLIVMDEGTGRVVAVSLQDSTVSAVLNANLYGTDGIVMDNNHNFYISDWTTKAVYRYDSLFHNRVKALDTYISPADIYFDVIHHKIAVPCFNENLVQFIDVATIGINVFLNNNAKIPVIYPNPCNDKLFISSQYVGNTTIKIFNETGQNIYKPIAINSSLTEINMADLKPGIYFVHIITGNKISYFKKIMVTR